MPVIVSTWQAQAQRPAACARKLSPLCARLALIFRGIGQSTSMNSTASPSTHVITVCDNAKESCPVFFGTAQKLHHSFDDPPSMSEGNEQERMAVFRRVRDELRAYLKNFAQIGD